LGKEGACGNSCSLRLVLFLPPFPLLVLPLLVAVCGQEGALPSACLVSAVWRFGGGGGPTLVGKLRRPPGAPLGGVLRSSSIVPHDLVMRWQLLHGLPSVVLPVGMARPSPPLRVVKNIHTYIHPPGVGRWPTHASGTDQVGRSGGPCWLVASGVGSFHVQRMGGALSRLPFSVLEVPLPPPLAARQLWCSCLPPPSLSSGRRLSSLRAEFPHRIERWLFNWYPQKGALPCGQPCQLLTQLRFGLVK
jgi:hypothetical protein